MSAPREKARRRSARDGNQRSVRGGVPVWGALGAALLALLSYANTIGHGYALDDGVVLHQNRFTTQGLSGIDELLTQDSFAGLSGPDQVLEQGRYRPLSLIQFAFEWAMLPGQPALSHAINILFYSLTAWLLFRLLWRWTRGNTAVAFATTALFVAHPVHTEVVANIKSRDELLLFFLFLLGLWVCIKRDAPPEPRNAVSRTELPSAMVLQCCALLLLALLAKETAVLFPVLFVAALWVRGWRLGSLGRPLLAMVAMTILFWLWRFRVVGSGAESADLLNNPFAGVPLGTKLATIVFIQLRYLGLVLWPSTLSHDYSIWQIPLRTFGDPLVWISILLLVAMLLLMVDGLRKRRLYGFGLLVYELGLLPVSNLLVNVGAPMGERFLYLPSFGILLAIADGAHRLLAARDKTKLLTKRLANDESPATSIKPTANDEPPPKTVREQRSFGRASLTLAVVLGGLVLAASARTIVRNQDWKNDETLFLADVENAPNSAKTNKAAASIWIERGAQEEDPGTRRENLERALFYLNRALEIYPDFADAYLDLGMARRLNGQSDFAEPAWQRYLELRPTATIGPTLQRYLADSYFEEGRALEAVGRPEEAQARFRAALRILPGHARAIEAVVPKP